MVKDIIINNETYHEISLENEYIKFSCLDYGATITEISTKDKNGNFSNNVLAFKDYNDYNHNGYFLGSCIAPLPGRIKNHQVSLQNKVYELDNNDNGNTLHSGANTTAFKKFDFLEKENGVEFTIKLQDLECGLPGELSLTVNYTLDKNKVLINYKASSTEDTFFSVTNHTYFNLDGKSILDHELFIDSNYFLTLDEDYCGSHHMSEVSGTGHDFREATLIRTNLEKELDSKEKAKGLDHAYILFDGENAVKLISKESGKVLSLSTDEESVVVYTGNYLNDTCKFKDFDGFSHAGIAFEPQCIPNGMNTLTSDAWFLKKGTTRESSTTLEFSVLENA